MNPWTRLQNLVAWGQTKTNVDDTGHTPTVQVQLSHIETMPGLQILQHAGFSSSPPPGSRVMALFGAGDRSKGTIIGTVDPATRRTGLMPGETVVHDMWGNEVHLSEAGVVVKHATKVTITCPLVRIEGALQVTGQVTAMCDGPSVTLSQHKHAGGPVPTPGT